MLYTTRYWQHSNLLVTLDRFQYILGAATSVATKVNEESLSYLNQGQSYEIKVKKLGDLTRQGQPNLNFFVAIDCESEFY